jgi:hypothetical protein
MKRLLVIGLAVGLSTGAYSVQKDKDKLEGAEAKVQITEQPQAIHVDHDSAIITWKTDSTAANNVTYRPVGSSEWKHSFLPKGSKDHWMKLTGLQPKTKYEYQILTTSNDVRASGQFETTGSGSSSTASPASNSTGNSGSDGTPQAASSSGMAPNASVGPNTQNGRVTLYRVANTSNGVNGLVTSPADVPSGFQVAGVAGYLVGRQAPKTVPLYAVASPNGNVFYTTDANERTQPIQQGWQDRGVIGYIATNQQSGTVPLYRMVDANGLNLFTTDPNQRAQAAAAGWKDVKIVGYVWSH